MTRLVTMMALAGIVLVAVPLQPAEAQWVFVARRVLGRIEHMQQDSKGGQPAANVATVMLEAPAWRVYAKARDIAHANPAAQVVSEDATNHRLEIVEGANRLTLSVQDLSNTASQLVILGSGPDAPTARVVERVMGVCKELHRTCTEAP